MADALASVRYRGIEGHACPRCAREGVWTHLRWLLECVTDHNAPEGRAWRVRPVVTRTPKREFRNDAKVTKWVREKGVERPVELWEHRFDTECPRCNRAFNRQAYVYHVFADDELPLDYWADHEANLKLMRARGVKRERIEAHERLLASIGVKRPPEGDGAE